MKLKKLDKFYQEVQTLDIRFKPNGDKQSTILSLSHYDEHNSTYRFDMSNLAESVLSFICTLPVEQIQYNANRLQFINERFERCCVFLESGFIDHNAQRFNQLKFLSYLNLLYLKLNVQIPQEMNMIMLNNNLIDVQFNRIDVENPPLSIDLEKEFLTNLYTAVTIKIANIKYLLFQIKTFTSIEPKLPGTLKERQNEETNIKNPSIPTSYKWTGNRGDLKKLYTHIHNRVIVDTSEESFIAAFTEKPIGSFNPIKWYQDNPSELLFFIKCMMPELIDGSHSRMDYQRLVGCFVKPDGKIFNIKSLSSLNQNLEINLDPAKQQNIKCLLAKVL